MTSEEWLKRLIPMARELNSLDEFGPLHIVVSDGNVGHEDIEWCLGTENSASRPLNQQERNFAERLLSDFTEEERYAIYSLSDCSDVQK